MPFVSEAAAASPALARLLAAAAARLRRLELVAGLPIAAAAFLAGAAAAAPLWQFQLGPVAGIPLAAGLGIAAWRLAPALSAPDPVSVAHRLDSANRLDDLLASAITVQRADPGMVAELHRRAAVSAGAIDPRSVGGWRLDRSGVAALGLSLVLLGTAAAAALEPDRPAFAGAGSDLSAVASEATPQAAALRAARAELAGALDPDAPARASGLDELARALSEDPATRNAGRALAAGDADGAAAELEQLGQRLSRMTADERARLQSTMENVLPEVAADAMVAASLQAAAEALAEHRMASAANALGELGEALKSSQAQLASQSELRERMEELGEQLGGTEAAPAAGEVAAPGTQSTAGGESSPTQAQVERIRSDGSVELVSLDPESDPAGLQPRPLQLGLETDPGRNPSAGLLGFARTAPAAEAPGGFAADQLLRSYLEAAGDE